MSSVTENYNFVDEYDYYMEEYGFAIKFENTKLGLATRLCDVVALIGEKYEGINSRFLVNEMRCVRAVFLNEKNVRNMYKGVGVYVTFIYHGRDYFAHVGKEPNKFVNHFHKIQLGVIDS